MAQVLYPNELQTAELVLEFLEFAPHRSLQVPTYHFRMVEPATGAAAGRINLRDSDAERITRYAGHIGYEVFEPFRGRHFAARAVEMLKPLAFRLGRNPLWITCNPENAASCRTCERAGGVLEETVAVPESSVWRAAGEWQKRRYRVELRAPRGY